MPHRRKLPWVASASLRETFEPLGVEPDDESSELSEKEVAVQNRLSPVRDLVSSLVASPDVEALVEDVAAETRLAGEPRKDAETLYALFNASGVGHAALCRLFAESDPDTPPTPPVDGQERSVRAALGALEAKQARHVHQRLEVAAERPRLEVAASKFVKRRGTRAWRTMREVLRRLVVARRAGRTYSRAVLRLADSAVDVDAPLDAGDPQQRGLAVRNREAAAMLVARATGRCSNVSSRLTRGGEVELVLCNVRISVYSDNRHHCRLHEAEPVEGDDRRDREAMTTLLRGVADALRVP